jgi:hypothetical protein
LVNAAKDFKDSILGTDGGGGSVQNHLEIGASDGNPADLDGSDQNVNEVIKELEADVSEQSEQTSQESISSFVEVDSLGEVRLALLPGDYIEFDGFLYYKANGQLTKIGDYNLPWVSRNMYDWVNAKDERLRRYSHFSAESKDNRSPPQFIGYKPTGKKTIQTKL